MTELPGHVRLDDLLRVCRAGDFVNQALLRELLMLFIEENERRIDNAMTAAATGNAGEFRGAVHAVKGSAALIGAERLQTLAGDCELRLVNGTLADPKADADQLRDEYTAVVATLKSLYPDLAVD